MYDLFIKVGISLIFIICLTIGLITAFAGSLLGLGGGVILIPTLLFLHQYSASFAWATPQTIVSISLIVMIFTALSSTISYAKKNRVDFRTGILFLLGSIPGGILGSWLNQFVDVDRFSLYFGILIIFLSMLMFIKREPVEHQVTPQNARGLRTFVVNGETYYYTVSVWLSSFISLIVGMLSGMFGIGGGAMFVPTMILLFRIPPHIATATSMFLILITSLISSVTHIILGHMTWTYVLFFIPGAWVGGIIGAKVNQLLKSRILEWLLRFVLIVIGLRLMFS